MENPQSDELQFLRELRGSLARIYHDISNPLAIVSGNLELMHELENAGADREEIATSIHDAHAGLVGFSEPLERFMALRRTIDERIEAARNDR